MDIYYSQAPRGDGFGAQYQNVIIAYIYAKVHNLNYVYLPLKKMEHNYNNDKNFIEKKEELINLKDNLPKRKQSDTVKYLKREHIYSFFEKNIDMCCSSEYMLFIKKLLLEK